MYLWDSIESWHGDSTEQASQKEQRVTIWSLWKGYIMIYLVTTWMTSYSYSHSYNWPLSSSLQYTKGRLSENYYHHQNWLFLSLISNLPSKEPSRWNSNYLRHFFPTILVRCSSWCKITTRNLMLLTINKVNFQILPCQIEKTLLLNKTWCLMGMLPRRQ